MKKIFAVPITTHSTSDAKHDELINYFKIHNIVPQSTKTLYIPHAKKREGDIFYCMTMASK